MIWIICAILGSDLETIANRLQIHVRFLASDALEGRETTYTGQKTAAAYLAAQLELMGISPGFPGSETPYFQSYPLDVTDVNRDKTRATLNIRDLEDRWVYQRDFFLLPLETESIRAMGSLIFAGFGINNEAYDDFAGLKVRDNWAIVVDGRPHGSGKNFKLEKIEGEGLFSKISYARSMGALGMILLKKGGPVVARSRIGARRPMAFPDQEEEEPDESLRFPVMVVYEAQWPRLFGKFLKRFERGLSRIEHEEKPSGFMMRGRKLSLELHYAKERRWAENVIGILPGGDPKLKDEFVVVSAHYDHIGVIDGQIFNGADDNATGTSALLLLAERLRQKALKRSLILLWTSGEEQGLLGSRYFLRNPVAPIDRIVADINADMIGRNVEGGVGVIPFANDDVSSLKTLLVEVNQKKGQGLILLDSMDHFHERSDHFPFIEKGIPAIFFLSGVHEDYHGTDDDWQRLDYAHFAQIYRLIEDFTCTVLEQDERPKFLKHPSEDR